MARPHIFVDLKLTHVQIKASAEADKADKLKQRLTVLESNLSQIKSAISRDSREGDTDGATVAAPGRGGAEVASVLTGIRSLQERHSKALLDLREQAQEVKDLQAAKTELQCVFV
jgi:hypothetical protein